MLVTRFHGRRALAAGLIALTAGLASCAPHGATGSPTARAAASSAQSPLASATRRPSHSPPASASPDASVPPLPAGFPVPDRLEPVPLPRDEPGLIARWTTMRPGPEIYDYFVRELPDAGFRIAGLYPGGAAAIIRFRLASGAVWQVVLSGDAGSTRIDVRLDRR
jgi:hypothetical protein